MCHLLRQRSADCFSFAGLDDPHLPANVAIYGDDQSERFHSQQHGRRREGAAIKRPVRFHDGNDVHRILHGTTLRFDSGGRSAGFQRIRHRHAARIPVPSSSQRHSNYWNFEESPLMISVEHNCVLDDLNGSMSSRTLNLTSQHANSLIKSFD